MASEANQNNSPTGIPFYVESSPRRVRDPSCPDSVDGWQGANEATFKLLEGLESLRDLRVVLEDLVAQEHPHQELRRIKRLSTPLYSFAWSVLNICSEVIKNPQSYGGITDQCEESVRLWKDEMLRTVPLSGESALRTIRNKIDAHVDSSSIMNPQVIWEHVSLTNYIPWLGCTITAFKHMLALNVFGWSCDSSHPDVWRIMSVDGTLVDFMMENGSPSYIIAVTQTVSPKVDIANELNHVITLHNTLLSKLPAGYFEERDPSS